MSYKKYTRNHGKTARISKYAWSNPDHRWVDSRTGHSLPCVNIGFTLTVEFFGGRNGRAYSGYKKRLRRAERRRNNPNR